MKHLILAFPLFALGCGMLGDLNGFPGDASNDSDAGDSGLGDGGLGDGGTGGPGNGDGGTTDAGNGDGGTSDAGGSGPIYVDFNATVFLGKAGENGSIDGTGRDVRLSYPRHIAKGPEGNFYVTEQQRELLNNEATVRTSQNGYLPGAIRQITPSGTATFYLGKLTDFRPGAATPSNRRQTTDVRGLDTLAFSNDGNLVFAPYVGVPSAGTCLIYQYRSSTDDFIYIYDSGINAQIPSMIVRDRDGCGISSTGGHELRVSAFAIHKSSGEMYVSEFEYSTLRRLTPASNASPARAWNATLWAGAFFDRQIVDGNGSVARMTSLGPIAFGPDGTLYIAETESHVIRKITPGGSVSTVAGSVGKPGHVDGMGFEALFNFPRGIAVDSQNTIYIADWGNRAVRRIQAAGVVRTLAGKKENIGTIDGLGEAAGFGNPWGLYVDETVVNGNHVVTLYVTDPSQGVIRKLVR